MGTGRPVTSTWIDVDDDEDMWAPGCRAAREVISADVDGEAGTMPQWVRQHRAECRACAEWVRYAERMDRMLRVASAVPEGPVLAESILAQVRLPRRGRWRTPLRVALAVVALAQLAIGLVSLFSPVGMGMGMMASPHMDHEEAAFNVAFAIALVMVACNGRRASGQVPVLATFVGMVAVSSVFDLVDGNVTWSRLATHLPILVGLVLSVVLGRGPHTDQGPLGRMLRPRRDADQHPAASEPGWDEPAPPAARAQRRTPPPAAHRDIA